MTNGFRTLIMAGFWGCLGTGALLANPMSITIGGETDTLSITLLPSNGAVEGSVGATVGWGYSVDWEAASNLLYFTSTSVGSESNNTIMTPGSYTDFMGGTLLGSGVTTQAFDNDTQAGVGSYRISTDRSLAVAGAQDLGMITFDFYVTDSLGNPLNAYTYSGPGTAFSVTVPALTPESTPEPGTDWMLAGGVLLVASGRFRTRRSVRLMSTRRDCLLYTSPSPRD